MATSPTKRQKDVAPQLVKELGVDNALAVPRIQKVVVNTGIGRVLDNASKPDAVIERLSNELAAITGQRPVVTRSRQSIASFKTREGQPVGLKVTLRGRRAEDFLNRLIHVALPRSRDFKGINPQAIDARGNLTVGIREHTIFSEVADAPNPIGFELTVVTSTDDPGDSLALLHALGFPFKKEE